MSILKHPDEYFKVKIIVPGIDEWQQSWIELTGMPANDKDSGNFKQNCDIRFEWCRKHTTGEVHAYPGTQQGEVVYVFEHEKSALAFKLKWA